MAMIHRKNTFLNLPILFLFLIYLSGFFINSCKIENKNNNVDCSTYNYSDCNTKEPFVGDIYVKLTINSENPAVPITIFNGKLEDNVVVLRDTARSEKYDTLLPVGNYYTVTAKYKKGSSTIIAVDGDKISKTKTTTCDSVCWSVTSGNIDVRLK
jgi:hypothetical protein